MTLIDQAIRALARHYDTTEAEVIENLADMSEGLPGRSNVLLETVTFSLIAALGALNAYGFDDGAVTAAEEIAAEIEDL